MLKLFRQRKRVIKWVLWAIVLVVGFMMVVTLVPGIGGGAGAALDSPDVLAVVGERAISSQEIQRRVSRLQQSLQGASNTLFRRYVAEQVIEDVLFGQMLEQEAERLGVRITPEEVSAQIRQMPIFQLEGKFVGAAEYQRIVQQQFRLTVAEFEDEVRTGELGRKVFQLLTDGLSVSDAEVVQEFRARNEKVAVEYALFKPRALEEQIRPSEEELRRFFDERRDRYRLPERRRARIVLVGFDWVKQRSPITPEELQAYYDRNRENYRVAEQVRFRHILFRFPDAATEEQKEKIRGEARRVRGELARGKDFAKLAQEHSGDAATSEKGGEVGWVGRGQVVPELEKVIFSLQKGALSEPVEVGYGIHIVQVSDRQPARLKPLAEVRGEIESFLSQQKSQQEALRLAQRLGQDVRGGQTLAGAAEALDLRPQETQPFALTDFLPEFAGTTAVQEMAFRLKPNEVSEPVSVPTGYAVVELLEVLPARERAELSDVRDQVERALRQERAGELARQRAQALADAASKAGDLRAAGRAAGVEVKLSNPFTRSDSVPELGPAREFAGQVFALPTGGLTGPVRVGVNWGVLRVAARQEPDLRAFMQQQAFIAQDLLQAKRQTTFQLFREGLKRRLMETGKLRQNPRAIERVLGSS